MSLTPEHVAACRRQFPALGRQLQGRPVVYFDGPAGTQVPQRVVDAVSHYLAHTNANHQGRFASSHESDAVLDRAHQAVSDLLRAGDPALVSFGPNMTTLTLAMSRALARTWDPGDEIVVTNLEHDANFTPWVLAARDAQATVRRANIRVEDCTLDLDDLREKITERTRLVAVGCASNATGSVNPVRQICEWAREVGAVTFLDAVHYAPHALLNVEDLGCDLLVCSAYKFFGPHVGILYGRRSLLESLDAYKLRPASDALPSKWMNGTQNHEGMAGTLAAVDYLAEIGRAVTSDDSLDRRGALEHAYAAIADYERGLVARLLAGLAQLPDIRVWGITDPARLDERLPTVSITHSRIQPAEIAEELGRRGIFVWDGNYYALPLTEAIGVEPAGMVRIGLVHYNTAEEVDRLLEELAHLD